MKTCSSRFWMMVLIGLTWQMTAQAAISWYTTRAAAVAAAQASGKLILLVGGSSTCGKTKFVKTNMCERASIRQVIDPHYIGWYCEVNAGNEEDPYTTGLGGYNFPLVCVINPNDSLHFLDRSTDIFYDEAAFRARLLSHVPAGPVADAYEFDGHATTAKAIANGQTQNHTMHVAGDVDWVKFTVGAAGASNVRVETSGVSGDTHMWLFGPNNSSTLVGYDNDNGTGSFSLIQVATLAAGTYYLGIREYGDNATIAAYTVKVSWTTSAGPAPDAYEFDGHATVARDIANGQTQNHSVHVVGDVDWVKFTVGSAGATSVRVETGGASGDTHMWLFGPNSAANLIAYADEGGIGDFSLIQIPTLTAGTYYLGIREYGDNATIAAYTVKVNWLAGPGGLDAYEFDGTQQTAKTILNNEIQTHSIYPAGDVDWVKIQKPINETRTLRVETGGTTGDTKVWLFGPTGTLIAYNDDRSIGNYFSLINASLWGAGTYYIGVREWSAFSTIPAYTLKASWVTP